MQLVRMKTNSIYNDQMWNAREIMKSASSSSH